MGQARENRLARDENLPTRQLHGAIMLREHTPSKTENGFNCYLNFSNRSHSFLSVGRPCGHFRCKKKTKSCILGRFWLGRVIKKIRSRHKRGTTKLQTSVLWWHGVLKVEKSLLLCVTWKKAHVQFRPSVYVWHWVCRSVSHDVYNCKHEIAKTKLPTLVLDDTGFCFYTVLHLIESNKADVMRQRTVEFSLLLLLCHSFDYASPSLLLFKSCL